MNPYLTCSQSLDHSDGQFVPGFLHNSSSFVYCKKILENTLLPLCVEAKEIWSSQCQSSTTITVSNKSQFGFLSLFLSELITGITSLPWPTAKLPPGKKQFWTLRISKADFSDY